MDPRGSHVRHLGRPLTVLGVLAPTLAGVLAPTLAPSASADAPSATAAPRPVSIALPSNWQPEGIAAHGSRLYVGSLSTGGIFTTDTTGRNGRVLRQGGLSPRDPRAPTGRVLTGGAPAGAGNALKGGGNRIYATGAAGGVAYVFN